jgi:uracil-DNA glycosylase
VAIARSHLQQHLELAAAAYGLDAVLPAGRATARSAPAPVQIASPDPAAASNPIASSPIASNPVAAEVPAPARAASTAAAPRDAAPSDAAPRDAALSDAAPSDAALSDNAAAERAAVDRAAAALATLRAEVLPCTRCKLHEGRRHTVFGEGNPSARVLFVGEAPGAVEDQTGRPFVGPAGQLLDRIIAGAMGLQRSDVFIANINKCRPPSNREPQPDEVAACLPYLQRQIAIVRPEVIVCLGRTAAQNLLGTTLSTTALRGKDLRYLDVPVVVTWHPAYLLRDPSHKRETWEDIKRVNRLLGLPDVPTG